MMRDDTEYMRLALHEAEKGMGRTSPNPCVGAVIVRNDTVVGRGYHRKAGTAHAEVNAIADAGKYTSGATIYVTLEPCNHSGKTPPCTKAILDAGLSRVVVGMSDPNPSVTGGGSEYLRSQGIVVESGLLEDECRAINRPFIKYSQTGLPWIVMKAGMSLDGKITYVTGQGGKITGQQSQSVTHNLRNTLDAILVGVETVLVDDPSLTTRLTEAETARDPLRVVLDTSLRLPAESTIIRQQSGAGTWLYCGPDAPVENEMRLADAGAVVHRTREDDQGMLDLMMVLAHLGNNNIHSVLVEGGARVHGAMLSSSLVDEVYLFTAPFFIGDTGNPLLSGWSGKSQDECPRLKDIDCRILGDDLLIHGYIHK